MTRGARCGNWGSVASALIEKPGRGNFLPIVDGGYSLQYSPLMECREGSGVMILCQLDVTGRTEDDPAAQQYIFKGLGEHGFLVEVVSDGSSGIERSFRGMTAVADPLGGDHQVLIGFPENMKCAVRVDPVRRSVVVEVNL
jgi:hypothetical protein